MSKNTSIALSDHFQSFINEQIKLGHYASASEVVRAALRLFEEHSNKMARLRDELYNGEVGEAISMDDYKKSFSAKREQYLVEQGVVDK